MRTNEGYKALKKMIEVSSQSMELIFYPNLCPCPCCQLALGAAELTTGGAPV